MSGTIFGLGLSQRVKSTGKPESGWRLYLYEAGTSTPVTAYTDTALTAGNELPWPIEADASGTLPAFWLADGSYRARGVSSSGGTIFYDLPSVLAIGASSGGGGGGDTTDPDSIFSTGMLTWLPVVGEKDGWIRLNGRTFGSATSGGSERAHADTEALYTYAWTNFSDTLCPVTGGRGISAAADFAAPNKAIASLDMRGRGPFGLDDMGNSAASRITATTASPDGITAAATGGAQTVTLSRSNLTNESVTVAVTDPGHTHGELGSFTNVQSGAGAQVVSTLLSGGANQTTGSASTGITAAFNLNNGVTQAAVNKMAPFMLGTWYWRL